MEKFNKPDKSLIKEEKTYRGRVTEIGKNEAIVRIYKDDGSYIQDVFDLSLFKKGGEIEEYDFFKLHTWELKTGEIKSFCEINDLPPKPASGKYKEELIDLQKKLKKLGKKLNDKKGEEK